MRPLLRTLCKRVYACATIDMNIEHTHTRPSAPRAFLDACDSVPSDRLAVNATPRQVLLHALVCLSICTKINDADGNGSRDAGEMLMQQEEIHCLYSYRIRSNLKQILFLLSVRTNFPHFFFHRSSSPLPCLTTQTSHRCCRFI